MHEFLVELVAAIVPWTEAAGIAIVMWGAIEGLVKLLGRLRSVLDSAAQPIPISRIRLAIGEKIALGLDFFWPATSSKLSLSPAGNRSPSSAVS